MQGKKPGNDWWNMNTRFALTLLGLAVLETNRLSQCAEPPLIKPVSIANPAIPAAAGGNGDSFVAQISGDGRFVVFVSNASNLRTNDQSSAPLGIYLDVFVRDLQTRQTSLVSVNPEGTDSGNDHSNAPVISNDGRFIAFESDATNLVTNDYNGARDIFVRDTVDGRTTLVSVGTDGQSGGGNSETAVITPDGRFVAFVSAAENLVANDTNGITDVFVRNLQTGVTTLVSTGAQLNALFSGTSDSPSISADGRVIAFTSTALNLVQDAEVTNTAQRIYVRDTSTGATLWASKDVHRLMGPRADSFNPVISPNGQFVAFKAESATNATSLFWHDLVAGTTTLVTTNIRGDAITVDDYGPVMSADGRFVCYTSQEEASQIYLWDSQTGSNVLVSVNLQGSRPANDSSDTPNISSDGSVIAFLSIASDLVTNSVSGEFFQVYVRDLKTGKTQIVSTGQDGSTAGTEDVFEASLSPDGTKVLFASSDNILTLNDDNNAIDLFVRDLSTAKADLVSVEGTGLPSQTGNGWSTLADNSVSEDGRFVVFSSLASNLVTNMTEGRYEVFLRDLVTQSTTLISASTNGSGTDKGSQFPVISANGRYVVFQSAASDLVPNDMNGQLGLFIYDVENHSTRMIPSVAPPGRTLTLQAPQISADGHYVMFSDGTVIYLWDSLTGFTQPVSPTNNFRSSYQSHSISRTGRYLVYYFAGGLTVYDSLTATTHDILIRGSGLGTYWLGQDDRYLVYDLRTNLQTVIHRYDLQTQEDAPVSVGYDGAPYLLGGAASLVLPSLTPGGRFVAFQSTATNVVLSDTNGASDVFVRDLELGTNILISINRDGTTSGNAASDQASISFDGRYVTFRSYATNLVNELVKSVPNIYVRDLVAGITRILSASGKGDSGNNLSSKGFVSGDGRVVLFESFASDLVEQDENATSDIFYAVLSPGNILAPPVSIRAPGTGMTVLNWPLTPGLSYGVDYKTSLSDPLWIPLSGTILTDGQTASFSAGAETAGTRGFYRLHINP